jgi:hypothetical protein
VVDQLEKRVLLTAAPLASYHFDEGSGATAADSSGNSNTATLFGTASFEHYDLGMTTGAAGSDLATGGTGGADIGNPAALNFTGPITLSAWIKPSSITGLQNIVAHTYDPYAAQEVYLRMNNGNYEVGSYDGTAHHQVSFPIAASDQNHWVHLGGTYDGTQWTLYRDGHLLGASVSSVGAVAVNADWVIGASAVAGDRRYFNGGIDDVQIYNQALSESEIQQAMGYQPPALNVDTSIPAAEGQPYTLNLSATYPTGIPNTVSSWTLDWGDGSGVATAAGATVSLTHTYATPGEYVLVATATDAQGVHQSDAAELDATFGDGGIASTPMPAGSSLQGLTTQYGFGSPSMLYFVSAGTAGSDMTLVRNTVFGGLDTGFGSGGIASAHLDGYTLHGEGMAIDDQNRILLSGYATPTGGGVDQFALARFNFDGTLDSTFGNGGIATLGAAGHDDLAYCVLSYSYSHGNSKILLGGEGQRADRADPVHRRGHARQHLRQRWVHRPRRSGAHALYDNAAG